MDLTKSEAMYRAKDALRQNVQTEHAATVNLVNEQHKAAVETLQVRERERDRDRETATSTAVIAVQIAVEGAVRRALTQARAQAAPLPPDAHRRTRKGAEYQSMHSNLRPFWPQQRCSMLAAIG